MLDRNQESLQLSDILRTSWSR